MTVEPHARPALVVLAATALVFILIGGLIGFSLAGVCCGGARLLIR